VSPLLGVGRTRRRDTLVPHVSSDRRDSSPRQKNDPFPAVSLETRQSGCDLFPISCLFGSVGTLGGLPAYERLPPFDPVSPGRARRPRSTSENRFAENRSHISPVVVAARLSRKSLIPPSFAVPREGVEKGQSVSEERRSDAICPPSYEGGYGVLGILSGDGQRDLTAVESRAVFSGHPGNAESSAFTSEAIPRSVRI
jgi:hypothetical protein